MKNIYKLELHEKTISPEFKITRVAGGWIYQNKMGMAFVPFNNEFQN